MTTNGEWLDYLAQNAPDELAAWFDAEHVEHEERALDGDTEQESSNTDTVSERYATAFKWLDRLNYGKGGVVGGSFIDTPEQGEVVMPLESWRKYLGTESDDEDSRDKIEADVRKIAEVYNMDTQRHGTERFADELYHSIIHLLNRQRAIDDSICDECSSDFYKLQEDHDKLVDEVDELKAERDKLEELNGYHAAQYELASEDCDRLQAQVDRLTAELEKATNNLNSANEDFENARAELTAERDELQSKLAEYKDRSMQYVSLTGGKFYIGTKALTERIAELTAERERYRDLFGKCIDYADAIHALMDDEGMA